MTNEAIQLLKRDPDLCKEIAVEFAALILNGTNWEKFYKDNTKPDWEILEFKYKGLVFKRVDKYVYFHYQYGYCGIDLVDCTVHSVRRSDGEVFTIKDNTNQGVIDRFFIHDGNMVVDCKGKYKLEPYNINNLTKLKPLFKTEDGCDYYEGDPLFEVYGKDKTDISQVTDSNLDVFMMDLKAGHRLAFSTRSAAEQWVEDNKPQPERKQVSVRNQLLAFFG